MKKKKTQKTNAMRLIEKAHISYQLHEFPWSEGHLGAEEVFSHTDVPKELIYKTLVAKGDKTGVVIACIPGTSELDLKALAKVSGNKKVEMAPLKDLETITGYVRGGCSPIGMKKPFPVYVSKRAETLKHIVVSAGKRGMQVELQPADLLKLTNAEYVTIEESVKQSD